MLNIPLDDNSTKIFRLMEEDLWTWRSTEESGDLEYIEAFQHRTDIRSVPYRFIFWSGGSLIYKEPTIFPLLTWNMYI